MKLKYENELKSIPHCPPDDAKPTNREAFRFVHEPITDSRNFVPAAKLRPRRRFVDDATRCLAWALSLFSTRELAVKRYHALKRKHKRIYKTIGTHLASGRITKKDGSATSPRSDGHFSFFEAHNCDLARAFTITERLYDDQAQGK